MKRKNRLLSALAGTAVGIGSIGGCSAGAYIMTFGAPFASGITASVLNNTPKPKNCEYHGKINFPLNKAPNVEEVYIDFYRKGDRIELRTPKLTYISHADDRLHKVVDNETGKTISEIVDPYLIPFFKETMIGPAAFIIATSHIEDKEYNQHSHNFCKYLLSIPRWVTEGKEKQ